MPKAISGTEKKTWFTETRSNLIGQLLTVLLTPLTVAVTLYLNEYYKKANPSIDFSEESYYTAIVPVADTFRTTIRESYTLYNSFQRQLDNVTPEPKSAKDWLNGNGDWDDDCESVFKDIAAKTRTELMQINHDDQLSNRLSEKERDDAKRDLSLTNDLIKELNVIDTSARLPTGRLDMTFGILNKTSFDGLIYKDAVLKFDNKEIPIESDSGYIQLKPHALQKITFSTYDVSSDGKLFKSFSGGTIDYTASKKEEYQAMKDFAEIVRTRKKTNIEVILKVDDRKLPSFKVTIND